MTLASLLGACLGDIVLPPCVVDHTCRQLSIAGAAGSPGDDLEPTGTAGGVGGDNGSASAAGVGSGNALLGGTAGAGENPVTNCPTCLISPVALAPGCAGHTYAATLMFQGGTAPYSWQVIQGPTGWSVAASVDNQAVLHGDEVPAEGVALVVKAIDTHGLFTTQTFHLDARTHCWFAVTTPANSSAELALFDPLSQTGKAATLKHQDDAYDFRFSPDGKWLAYRYGAGAIPSHSGSVALVELESMTERELHFGADGGVTSYAWAPTSAVLAAAFVDGAQTSLGAVRLPAVGSAGSPTSLGIIKANVDSPLTWVDDRYVVFHGPTGEPGLRAVYYALLEPTGFESPKSTLVSALSPVTIAANSQGFFVIAPEQVSFNSLQNDAYAFNDHPWNSLVSPGGRTTAIVNSQQLLVVHAAMDGDTAITSEAGVTCPRLLASSPGADRVACVANVPLADGGVRGEVRFFDVSGSSNLLARTLGGSCEEDLGETSDDSCLHNLTGYSYGEAQAVGTARSFSGSGRYFAFARTVADDTYVYWADLREDPPKLVGSVVLTKWDETQPVSVMSFSPDERFLFVQRGARLAMAEVLTGASTLVSGNVTSAPPCSEELIDPAFCGNPDGRGALQFSADSRALAMRASQRLKVFDLSPFPKTLYTYQFSAPPCGDTCAGAFAFQPQLPP